MESTVKETRSLEMCTSKTATDNKSFQLSYHNVDNTVLLGLMGK
jgi:hypothetical protein